jgi:hypothetical protein
LLTGSAVGGTCRVGRVIRDGRHEVDSDAYLMFVSIRALLRKGGMASCDSDRQAGQIMALLNP